MLPRFVKKERSRFLCQHLQPFVTLSLPCPRQQQQQHHHLLRDELLIKWLVIIEINDAEHLGVAML